MSRQASVEAQRVGASLEALLTFTHNLYWNRYQIWIEHNGISGVWRSGRAGKRFTPVSREAAPDYYGCVGGRFVAFDAKSTKNKTRWRLHADYGHQFERLQKIHVAGGVAFFFVECRHHKFSLLLRVTDEMDWPVVSFSEPLGSDVAFVTLNTEGFYDWALQVPQSWLAWTPTSL